MTRGITKPGFDLGLVTNNGDAMLAFYRDAVGLVHEGTLALEPVGIARMDRLRCGDSVLKLVTPMADDVPAGIGGGITGSTGYRYLTISVDDIDSALADCEAVGAPVVWPKREIMPGRSIAMVEDPDGNWLEFIHQA